MLQFQMVSPMLLLDELSYLCELVELIGDRLLTLKEAEEKVISDYDIRFDILE